MSCTDCSRRAFFRGIAFGTTAVLIGCGNDHAAPDATEPVDASTVDAAPITTCGGNLCIDVSLVTALQTVNGSLIVSAPAPSRDRIMVLRSTDTEFVTVSDICTHTGCGVRFNVPKDHFVCPCHGSEFALTGAVIRGPAARALKLYANTFDAATQLLTITIA